MLPSVLPPTAASALSRHRLSALALVVHLPEAKRQAADDGGGVGVGWGWGILPRPRDAAPCGPSSRGSRPPPIATAPGHALKPPQGLLAPGRVCRSASAFHVSLTWFPQGRFLRREPGNSCYSPPWQASEFPSNILHSSQDILWPCQI